MTEVWSLRTLKRYDVNGHLYLNASHHDGTNRFEIKRLTERVWGAPA